MFRALGSLLSILNIFTRMFRNKRLVDQGRAIEAGERNERTLNIIRRARAARMSTASSGVPDPYDRDTDRG